jgi:hypothetical protein
MLMRIQDLLEEYRSSFPEAPLGDFDALLASEASRQQRRRIVLPIFLAGAAALLIVLLLPRKAELVPSPAAVPASSLPAVAAALPVSEPIKFKARPRRKIARAEKPEDEYREFIPLAQSRLLPQSDVMQVLRVSVSSDRLAALGIPASITYSSEGDNQVAAELLLGEDGLVRAVRVLR